MSSESKPNMKVLVTDGILMVVHNDKPPSDLEWHLYPRAFGEAVNFQLVLTSGGGPNATQRKRAAALGRQVYGKLRRTVPKTAVVTPSAAMRGLVTLFNWMFPGRFCAFAPDALEDALKYIECPPASMDRIRATLTELHASLA